MTTVHGFVRCESVRQMFVSIGWLGVLGSLVSVLAATDGGVKMIDRWNASERNAYYVVFCARGGGLAFCLAKAQTMKVHDFAEVRTTSGRKVKRAIDAAALVGGVMWSYNPGRRGKDWGIETI